MATDTFIVRPGDKPIVFIRTETGRLFRISNSHMNGNGMIPKAVDVPASYLAELVRRYGIKSSVKGRVTGIRKRRREEVI